MALLEKAYANALLFSVGLLLGSAGEATGDAAAAPGRVSPPPPESAGHAEPSARWRFGTESDELSALRRSESRVFGQLDDLAAELELMNERLDAFGQNDDNTRFGGVPAMSQLGDVTPGFFESLRMPEIPVQPNARLEKYVRYFTSSGEGRKTFVAWLQRSGKYREIILEELRNKGLPQDLIAVTFIESGLRPTAVSPAGATGLWQFMPRTARAYGLTVGRRYDERRSVWHATDAAVRHLADLYEYFGNWEMALAAYNYGYERLAAVAERLAVKDFWSLSAVKGALPRETALYVPKVLAVAIILNNLDRFDLDDVSIEQPVSAAPVKVPGGTRLSLVARAGGTSLEAIRSLNPQFRRDEAPRGDRPVWVYIPADGLARARVMLPRLLQDADRDTEDARVPSGFNWGRDDPDRNAMDRLRKTTPGGDELPPAPAPSFFGGTTTRTASYFETDDQKVTDQRDAPQVTPWRSTASEIVAASGTQLSCETPADALLATVDPEPAHEPTAASPMAPGKSSDDGRQRGKQRKKPRSDRQLIFYLTRPDETMQAIAQRFRLDEHELRNVNRMRRDEKLAEGTLLRIPVPHGEAGAR